MMPNGSPNPQPKTGIARRLESIRAQTGYSHSLRAFWRRLTEGWDDDDAVSYEAVRRYHWKREPPVSYLSRVVEVFPQYSLEWLATGEEPGIDSHRKVRKDALHRRVAEAYPDRFDLLPRRSQDLFLHVLMKRIRSAPDAPDWVRGVAWDSPGDVPDEVVEYAGDLLHALFYSVWRELRPSLEVAEDGREDRPASLPAWGVDDPRNVTPDRLEQYVRLSLAAEEIMIPEPGQGDPWENAEKGWHRVDRREREKDLKKMSQAEEEES